MEREQFTFYRSFYKAIKRLKRKEDRLSAYESIITYALDGEELPMTDVAESIFELVRPVLDSASKRATSGKIGGGNGEANVKQTESKAEANEKQTRSKTEANVKQTESKREANVKQTRSYKEGEGEKEKEIEIEKDFNAREDDGFESFWAAYPIKSGDIRQAYFEYLGALKTATADEIMAAVTWQGEEKGRFMGSAEKWLRNKGWTEKRQEKTQNQNSIHGGKDITVSAEDFERLKEMYDQI